MIRLLSSALRAMPVQRVLSIALAIGVAALAAENVFSAQKPAAPKPDAPTAIEAQAEAAARENRTGDAVRLYRRALASRPRWAEGWWALGTLLYDADRHAEAATAFGRAATLAPTVGSTWVMLGLSEYALGRYDKALAHVQRGHRLGVSADPQFRRVMLYHEAVLLLRNSEFERAQEVLGRLAKESAGNEDVMLALGQSVLRVRPQDPPTPGAPDRAILLRAGEAERLAALKQFGPARAAYEALAAEAPQTRNVHYALARYFVAARQPDEAVAAYERELAATPAHVPARLGIAAIKAESEPQTALKYAEEAVSLNPRIPLGHYLLGTLLLTTDDTPRAIAELELAKRSVSTDPRVYFELARAYTKAGRQADAARARDQFTRLTDEQQKASAQEPDAELPAASPH